MERVRNGGLSARILGAALVAGAALAGVLAAGTVAAQEKAPGDEVASIYDTKADGQVLLETALARAARDNKRVLVVFGGNWCPWCRKLDAVFRENREIARILLYEYEVAKIDIGRFDKQMKIPKGYGADIENAGVPFLTILDARGKVLVNQETGALEEGSLHDPAKVKAFLEKWKAPPLEAEAVLREALARAAKEGKNVFLHFGAPWCGWCHRLENFLARPEVAKVFAKDFVDLKIDVDRMTDGKTVSARFRGSEGGGIPWSAFLDAEGKVIVTSDGPEGNIGYPTAPAEIAHFLAMLRQARKNMTPEDIDAIGSLLEDAAREMQRR